MVHYAAITTNKISTERTHFSDDANIYIYIYIYIYTYIYISPLCMYVQYLLCIYLCCMNI